MCVVHVYSVDDEAFLQQMNVVSQEFETPSQEYETNYDEENLDGYYEGFLDEPRGRTANYTAEEDKLIVLAWKKVGLDPAVGTEQPKDTYWRRMKEFFDARNNTGNVRTVISIRHRWGTISTDCQKWSACLTHVDHLNPSGTNGGDRVSVCFLFIHQIIFSIVLYVANELYILSYVEKHCSKLV